MQKMLKYWPWFDTNGEFERTMVSLGIDDDRCCDIRSMMRPLDIKGDVGHYHADHSRRVAILCAGIGRIVHLDAKALFYAGALHDVGKLLIKHSTLGKCVGWTAQDSKTMECHVFDSYKILRDKFNFTAEVILWHHRFQKNAYPRRMPAPLADWSQATRVMIPFYGRLLMLADVYDAMHRVYQNPEGQDIIPSEADIRRMLIQMNPDLGSLIEDLYSTWVFNYLYQPEVV